MWENHIGHFGNLFTFDLFRSDPHKSIVFSSGQNSCYSMRAWFHSSGIIPEMYVRILQNNSQTMEKLLYQKVFESASKTKSAVELGQLSSFVAKAITEKYAHLNHDVVSSKTIKRGFQEFLPPELLEPFNKEDKAEDETKERKKYTPDLKTLNLLAKYLEYASFADFSSINKHKEESEETEDNSSKITYNNNQQGEGNTNIWNMNADTVYL